MFRNAWNLGTIDGIKIRLHWSFLLLPIWVFYTTLVGGLGATMALISVVFVLAVFGCVLLHELGHALAARQFGIGTRDIVLLPIGGVASLERMPRNPFQELWIAVAGPLVNVVIAAAILVGLQFAAMPESSLMLWLLQRLIVANVILVVFNMIPAFPMDGGRVFRSLLAIVLPYTTATSIAATVGMICAIGLGMYGLFSGHFLLILLAGFVYLAGQAEKSQVLLGRSFDPGTRQAFDHRVDRGSALDPTDQEFSYGQQEINVPASLSGDSVAAWLAHMRADYCNVMESGHMIGRLTKQQLMSALARGLGNLPVGRILVQSRTH